MWHVLCFVHTRTLGIPVVLAHSSCLRGAFCAPPFLSDPDPTTACTHVHGCKTKASSPTIKMFGGSLTFLIVVPNHAFDIVCASSPLIRLCGFKNSILDAGGRLGARATVVPNPYAVSSQAQNMCPVVLEVGAVTSVRSAGLTR